MKKKAASVSRAWKINAGTLAKNHLTEQKNNDILNYLSDKGAYSYDGSSFVLL
jgi:hypothetical protein